MFLGTYGYLLGKGVFMSRIGKRPVLIPDGVKVSVTDSKLKAEGPKGSFEYKIPGNVKVVVDGAKKQILVSNEIKTTQDNIMHGTVRSLINNIIVGVHTGYEKKIEINGVGYKAVMQGKDLVLSLGFSHPLKIDVPAGINITIPNPNQIIITGVNKELVGSFSADLRSIKYADPYNLKGLKYMDEVIKKKAGKTFVSGTT